MLALHLPRRFKGGAIPEVAVKERLRGVIPVVGQSGIGQRAYVYIAHQGGARHGSRNPVLGVEAFGSNGFALGLYLRGTCQLPVAAIQQEASVFHAANGVGLSHHSTTAHHLHLAHDVSACSGGLRHQHTHIACLGSLKADIVGQCFSARQLCHGAPCTQSGSHVNASAQGFLYPVQVHLVDGSLGTQVDICPLLSTLVAHPCRCKLGRGLQIGYGLRAVEEFHLGQCPIGSARHIKGKAQVVKGEVAQGQGQLNNAQG